MRQNFEQNKSVPYWLLSSDFVIPWEVEDTSRIHAEVSLPDGTKRELVPIVDFTVDGNERILSLTSSDLINAETSLVIFDGKRQELNLPDAQRQPIPHSLVVNADLKPIEKRLDDLKPIVKRLEDLKPVHSRLDKVETVIQSIPASLKDKIQTVDVLHAKTEDISQRVDSVTALTTDVCKKIDQIDFSKLEGLDPKTKNYLANVQKRLSDRVLTLTKGCGFGANISFHDEQDDLKAQVALLKTDSASTNNSMVIAAVGGGYYKGQIQLYQDKDIYLNRQEFVRGSDASIFDNIIRKLTPMFLSLMQGRTCVICANLGTKKLYELNDIVLGEDIIAWSYPTEDTSGYLCDEPYERKLIPDATDKARKWRIFGRTRGSYYSSIRYWLQEVIDLPDTVVLKTVSNATLADNLVDLKAIQSQLQGYKTDLASTVKTDVFEKRLKKVEATVESNARPKEDITALKKELDTLRERIEALEPLKHHFAYNGSLIINPTRKGEVSSIYFTAKDKGFSHALEVDYEGFSIKERTKDGGWTSRIQLSDKGIKLDGLTIQEYIKVMLHHRTGIFAAELVAGKNYNLWDLIQGSDIVSWKYPCEDANGYKHAGNNALMLSAANKAKQWRIFGISTWEHHGNVTYWLQEEI